MTALSHCITCGEWTDGICIYGGCPFRAEGRSMTARLRTIAACDADAIRSLAPWSLAAEDTTTAAWRAVQGITPEMARQEWRMVDALIEHLQSVREQSQ